MLLEMRIWRRLPALFLEWLWPCTLYRRSIVLVKYSITIYHFWEILCTFFSAFVGRRIRDSTSDSTGRENFWMTSAPSCGGNNQKITKKVFRTRHSSMPTTQQELQTFLWRREKREKIESNPAPILQNPSQSILLSNPFKLATLHLFDVQRREWTEYTAWHRKTQQWRNIFTRQ